MPQLNPVERFQRLFRGRETTHGQLDPARTEGHQGWTVKRAAGDAEWTRHLAGGTPWLGMIPHQLDNTTYFGVVDVDDTTVNHAAIASLIEHANLPLVVCRSRSGGAHLFLFLREAAPTKLVRAKLKSWHNSLGLKSNPDGRTIEVFPKADRLQSTEQGNWISLPYWGALGKATIERVAIKADGLPLSFEQFLDYAERQRISPVELEAVEATGGMFPEGPPCLNSIMSLGIPEGGRNMTMVALATMYRYMVVDEEREGGPLDLTQKPGVEEFTQLLLELNSEDHFDPPLEESEVRAVAKSVAKRAYSFKCEEIPLKPHCDKKVCKTRRYGVGAMRKQLLGQAMPKLSGLRKVTSDPPRWILTVDGLDVDLATEDLMQLPRFRRVVLEKRNRIFPLLKQTEWDETLVSLTADLTIVEAPEDAGEFGQFMNLLGEYLQRRRNATTVEDLRLGLPLEFNGRVHFKSTAFIAFLERKRFRPTESSVIYGLLRKVGVDHGYISQKGDQIRTWHVPIPKNDIPVEEDNGHLAEVPPRM